jgi:hypothetical protein
VNPVVGVLLGHYFGGKALGLRTIWGTARVLISVLVLTTIRARSPAQSITPSEDDVDVTAGVVRARS